MNTPAHNYGNHTMPLTTGTDAVQDTDLVKEMYAVMIPLITVLLVALFVITLIVFVALSWRKLQRDRYM